MGDDGIGYAIRLIIEEKLSAVEMERRRAGLMPTHLRPTAALHHRGTACGLQLRSENRPAGCTPLTGSRSQAATGASRKGHRQQHSDGPWRSAAQKHARNAHAVFAKHDLTRERGISESAIRVCLSARQGYSCTGAHAD
jgi:hypothetical protein